MLPIAEVAVLLDVSVRTLQRLHESDPAAYPARQVGREWRIPREWVERQIACEAPAP